MKTRHALAGALVLVAGAASADTLTFPVSVSYDPPNSPQGVLRPARGLNMQAVLARFGEPKERIPAVGEPPITRWVYERYTVYFEHDLTLHTVVRRGK
jgi:hypothetical protein